MIDAVRFEWVRLRTVRSTWVLTVLALALTGLLGGVIAVEAEPGAGGTGYADLMSAAALFTPVLMGLVGAFAYGHEFRYGTIRPTLCAVPRRERLHAAKIIVVGGYAAGVAIIAVALSLLLGEILGGDAYTGVGLGSDPAGRVALGAIIYIVLWAMFGLAYGGLFRNIPAAITLLLVFPLVAENLIRLILSIKFLEPISDVGKYLPFVAGSQMLSTGTEETGDAPAGFVETLSPLAGGVTMTLWAVALVLLTGLLFVKRDA